MVPVSPARATARGIPIRAVATLGLACLAAVTLAAGAALTASPTAPEDLAVLVWVAGWALVGWAALAAAVGAVGLVRATARGRRPGPARVALVLTAVGVLIAVVVAHPLAGSGAASAPVTQVDR